MPRCSLSHLHNDQLTHALDTVASNDRLSDAAVLQHIAEFDARKLYLPTKYPSMFRYCVGRLRMSEGIAYKRVRVARIARKVPALLDAIESGRLNTSGVSLLARHLTRRNARELLAAAQDKTRLEIQALLAERFPAAPTNLGKLPGPVAESDPVGLSGGELASPQLPANVTTESSEQAPGPVDVDNCLPANALAATVATAVLPAPLARVTPIAPGCFELVAILGRQAYDQLMDSRDLLGHAVPTGDLNEVLVRAIALQHAQLRKRRCAAVARPRERAPGPVRETPRPANTRRIPAAVVRAVWKRDDGRCAFVGADGHRCEERGGLELDHIVPRARGGRSTVENLRLLCRGHNQFAAEREFGKRLIEAKRDKAKRRRLQERAAKQAERERAEARRAEIARQRNELGEAFRMLGYRGHDLERALAYCACRPEAPPEERVRHALACMAPKTRHEFPGVEGAA